MRGANRVKARCGVRERAEDSSSRAMSTAGSRSPTARRCLHRGVHGRDTGAPRWRGDDAAVLHRSASSRSALLRDVIQPRGSLGHAGWRLPRSALGLCLLAVLSVVASCSDGSDERTTTAEALLAPGPHAVVKTTLTLVDPDRSTPPSGSFQGSPTRTLVTDVYAPAIGTPGEVTEGAQIAAAEGPFPLVVFAHGFGGGRQNFTATLAHLASRGFVDAAPDFPSTGLTNLSNGSANVVDWIDQSRDVSFVIDSLLGRGAPEAASFA